MDSQSLLARIPFLPENPEYRAAAIVLAAVVVAVVVRVVIINLVHAMTRSTDTEVDDQVASHLKGPAFWSIIVGGVWLASQVLDRYPTLGFVIIGLAQTALVSMWSVALFRTSRVILEALSRNVDRFRWIQPKTVPLLMTVTNFLVAGFAVYFFCEAWSIPLTHWLASAGIIGIAVGFAAKDSLAVQDR